MLANLDITERKKTPVYLIEPTASLFFRIFGTFLFNVSIVHHLYVVNSDTSRIRPCADSGHVFIQYAVLKKQYEPDSVRLNLRKCKNTPKLWIQMRGPMQMRGD